jgi:hypothetical protein
MASTLSLLFLAADRARAEGQQDMIHQTARLPAALMTMTHTGTLEGVAGMMQEATTVAATVALTALTELMPRQPSRTSVIAAAAAGQGAGVKQLTWADGSQRQTSGRS